MADDRNPYLRGYRRCLEVVESQGVEVAKASLAQLDRDNTPEPEPCTTRQTPGARWIGSSGPEERL